MSYGTRPHTGGPKRTVSRAELVTMLERELAAPRSAERTAALHRLRSKIRSCDCRSERNGA